MEKCEKCDTRFKKEELVNHQVISTLSPGRLLTYRYCKRCYEFTTGKKYKEGKNGR